MTLQKLSRDDLYQQAAETYGPALDRLARVYEADPDKRLDLLQEIHLSLWRSFEGFDSRCSLRTWIYRVAHNTAASYVIRQKRKKEQIFLSLEDLSSFPSSHDEEHAADQRKALDRLLSLIHALKPLDRQVMLSYLEGMDAAEISDITAISPANVATKIHRIKHLLTKQFHQGESHAE